MAGTDLCKEATFGLSKGEGAAPYGPYYLARRSYREGFYRATAAGVLLLTGLLSIGNGSLVGLFGGRA